MLNGCIRNVPAFLARRCFVLLGVLTVAAPLWAQKELGPITVGAGLQTSFVHNAPRNGDSTEQLQLNSMSLGIVNKLLEPYSGAVLAKIFVLVALILFIQRRPRGLFPQTGRSAENG